MINNATSVILRTEVMTRFVMYKNGRKYSDIKFSDIDTCKEYIRFHKDDIKAATNSWYFDLYEYPSGKFVTRLVVEDTNKGSVFTENCPVKTPRNRKFIKK